MTMVISFIITTIINTRLIAIYCCFGGGVGVKGWAVVMVLVTPFTLL